MISNCLVGKSHYYRLCASFLYFSYIHITFSKLVIFPLFSQRHLANSETFWLSPEIEACLDITYDTALHFDVDHLSLIAFPQNKDSKCPIIEVDNGYINNNDNDDLVPIVSVLAEVPTGGLSLDHSVTFESLSWAVSQLSPADHSIDKNEYNILDNNCASLLLYVFEKIGLDYKDPETNTNIVNYVGKSLAASEPVVRDIHEAYLKKNAGMLSQTKFHVWNFLVGDEGMTHALVRNYMDAMQ